MTTKWPKQSPNQIFLGKILHNAENFRRNGKILPNLVTLTFVESVDTFIESRTFVEGLSS
jgi:hypothetical protein